MLLCSTGLSFSSHFCGGSLEGFAIGESADNCHHEQLKQESCCESKSEVEVTEGCCVTSLQTFFVDDDYTYSVDKFSLSTAKIFTVILFSFYTLPKHLHSSTFYFEDRHPPNILDGESIRLLYQCFRL